MAHFHFHENELYCEEVPVRELVEEFDTPLYVYSKNRIIENFRSLHVLLQGEDQVVCYAVKANANSHVLKLLASQGAGADVVSAGELHLALKAGFKPDRIVFAGVGKREEEIEYALRQNIHSFNVESLQEMQTISRSAFRLGMTAKISLRINPDIDAESHPYISTGLKHNKFGIEGDLAPEAFKTAAALPNLSVIGIHTHIGSQITRVEPYVTTANFVVDLVTKLREAGILIQHIDFGGGFGVDYVNAIRHEAFPVENGPSEAVPSAAAMLSAVLPILQHSQCSIWIEPGRCIVADAGILVTKVLYTKENTSKKFVIVDAGMNDLLRPSLYNAYHQIVPAKILTYDHEQVDVVGPVCETGDFLARDRKLLKVKPNEYLAIMTTGAYGFVNASNYNGRLRPAEVMVNGEKVRLIRQRETIEQLG
jgi:diaminopimelate decarboxylase